MRKQIQTVLTIFALFVGYSSGQQPLRTPVLKYMSPDEAVVAIVASAKIPEATAESRVELRAKSARLLARRNYRSGDGEHGFGVTKACWTPDSQFFVYSLESSGGHQAWHSPIQFYSRRDNKIFSLDDALNDAVINPQFSVTAPNRVTVDLQSGGKTKTVSLASLRHRKRTR